jgi:hypothetical protein
MEKPSCRAWWCRDERGDPQWHLRLGWAVMELASARANALALLWRRENASISRQPA